MALYLTENDVEHLITMHDVLEAVEGAFRRQARGDVLNQPRRRLHLPEGTYHTMVAADLGLNTFALKAYTSYRAQNKFLVLLYDAGSGNLLALIEANRLGQMRTGAATGIATKYLARREKPLAVGIYGTGWQAQSQLEAVCAACSVESIWVYGRDVARREAFCALMASRLNLPVLSEGSPELTAAGKEVLITATTSAHPVLRGEWVAPGCHINAIGSNMLMRREVDDETLRRSDLIVVDSIEQSKMEAGDLLPPFERRLFRWEEVVELSDLVGGRREGRTSAEQITFFKSNGIAMEDVAVATLAYQKAMRSDAGKDIALWEA
jgi:ornithine cyclodeaminase/alanine dehydrogenase-like protein (mu-crystallin family)